MARYGLAFLAGLTMIMMLALPASSATTAPAPAFHPPQTEAERALDKTLWIGEIDRKKMLQEVTDWLEGRADPQSLRYGDYFTRHYLEKWRTTQVDMMTVCKKHADDPDICEPFGLTCENPDNKNISYVYHTLMSNGKKAVISFIPQGWEGDGDTFHMAKESGVWKIDDTECAVNKWRTEK